MKQVTAHASGTAPLGQCQESLGTSVLKKNLGTSVLYAVEWAILLLPLLLLLLLLLPLLLTTTTRINIIC